MTRIEYRLQIVWPGLKPDDPCHSYEKSYRQEPRAAKAAAEYIAQGAQVTIEVWSHAGEDRYHGWFLNRERTNAVRNGAWHLWGVA